MMQALHKSYPFELSKRTPYPFLLFCCIQNLTEELCFALSILSWQSVLEYLLHHPLRPPVSDDADAVHLPCRFCCTREGQDWVGGLGQYEAPPRQAHTSSHRLVAMWRRADDKLLQLVARWWRADDKLLRLVARWRPADDKLLRLVASWRREDDKLLRLVATRRAEDRLDHRLVSRWRRADDRLRNRLAARRRVVEHHGASHGVYQDEHVCTTVSDPWVGAGRHHVRANLLPGGDHGGAVERVGNVGQHVLGESPVHALWLTSAVSAGGSLVGQCQPPPPRRDEEDGESPVKQLESRPEHEDPSFLRSLLELE
jgi:hypothetical protein